jgi:hypothetical protein
MVAFIVSVLAFRNSRQPGELIPAVLGTVTAAIGTLAGLVAGHAAGAAGKNRQNGGQIPESRRPSQAGHSQKQ